MSDVTRILNAIERGQEKATDELLPLVYEELRRRKFPARRFRRPPSFTRLTSGWLAMSPGVGTIEATSSPPRPKRCGVS